MLLEMVGISKSFPGVKALQNVNFSLRAGEVHALLGENGAGKSTLIRVLGGIYAADSGEIRIKGQRVSISSVTDAHKNAIRIIHQEIMLVPYRTVAENIFLGQELRDQFGFLDKKAMLRETWRILKEFGVDLKPQQMVAELSIGMQQLVEIMKAVFFDAQIIVMDEPTSSLSEKETKILFSTIRLLQQKGVGIIYISHKLSELFTIAHRVTILRDGAYIDTLNIDKVSNENLIEKMVGRELTKYYIKTDHSIGNESLRVEGLSKNGMFSNISFRARYGEIVGFSGLVGAGRTEVMKSLFGVYPPDNGKIFLEGRQIRIHSPRGAIAAGIAYIPENRKDEGLVLMNTVAFNMILVTLRQIIRFIGVDKKMRDETVQRYIRSLNIKVSSTQQTMSKLSGGNQQKVVLGKWLANNPKVLILDEPTRGIDVGAKSEIYGIMNQLTQRGVSIIMVSSELPEIINMCDRVYVMGEGKIRAMLHREELSQEKIMAFSAGGVEHA